MAYPPFNPVTGNPNIPFSEGFDPTINRPCNPCELRANPGYNPCQEKCAYWNYEQSLLQNPLCSIGFTVQVLVSNIPCFALNYDPNIINPWGIVVWTDIIWVANADSGLITTYDLLGGIDFRRCFPINVFGRINNIASATGIVSNCDPLRFVIRCREVSGGSTILVATEDGTINGYNRCVDPNNTITVVDKSAKKAVYKGLAISKGTTVVNRNLRRPKQKFVEKCSKEKYFEVTAPCDFLYATDFCNSRIDTFDAEFKQVTNFLFIDEYSGDPIPSTFAPYNIVSICDVLYVTYAKKDPKDNRYALHCIGNGYVSIFSKTGVFLKRFASRGMLNSPWGLILAPSWFGYPAGSILIGNYGDGTINVFDSEGKYFGKMKDCNGVDIYIEGLRGLSENPNYPRVIYWTASFGNGRSSCMGTISTRFFGY